jgi:hypothetical protein
MQVRHTMFRKIHTDYDTVEAGDLGHAHIVMWARAGTVTISSHAG